MSGKRHRQSRQHFRWRYPSCGASVWRSAFTVPCATGSAHRDRAPWALGRLFPLLLALVSLFLNGCQSKSVIGPSQPGDGDAPPQYPREATQRPYVINGVTYYPIPSARGFAEKGVASWYGEDFHGKSTANGESYNMYAKTAAHKILPMNTVLLVKNLDNGREVIVRVNDRGPFVKDRIIDLSYSAARELGIAFRGTAPVQVIALAQDKPRAEAWAQNEPARPAEQATYYVQVGSFNDQDNARHVASRLAAVGKKGVIQQIRSRAATVYRVLVYAGASLGEARGLEAGLSQSGFPNSFVLAR